MPAIFKKLSPGEKRWKKSRKLARRPNATKVE